MVYGLKLLSPILVLWALMLLPVRGLLSGLMTKEQVKTAFAVILAFSVVEFLSLRSEIFFVTSAVAMMLAQSWMGGDIKAKLAVFWMAVILFPPLQWQIGGVGGIKYFLALDHFRVAAIVLLIPAAINLAFAKPTGRKPTWLLDALVLSFPTLKILLLVSSVSMTTTLRSIVEMCLDVVLPYYVMTRGLRSIEELKFVLLRLMVAGLFAAGGGLLEAVVRKNIYSDIEWVYGQRWSLTHTLMRGGMNRVQTTAASPIFFAIQILVTAGLWLGLAKAEMRRGKTLFVLFVLTVVLVLTWSRGPLLGAALFALSLLLLSRARPWLFTGVLAAILLAAGFAKMSGADQQIMEALKSVFGTSQEDTVTIEYRSQLLDTAIALVKQSPWLGVPNYVAQMQDLKQGEGIIDIVNAYVSVALSTGLVGLVLYLSPFLLVLRRIVRELSSEPVAQDIARMRFLRAFAALIVGCLATIFTVSVFERLPFLLLLMVTAPAVWMSFAPSRDGSEAVAGSIPTDGFDDHHLRAPRGAAIRLY